MERVTVGDVEVGFRRTGAGPAVVLLHGAVSDGRVWRLAMDDLGRDHTVVAWDAPGCGGSSDPPDGWTMADFAVCLAGFLTELDLAPSHVVGHSWGSTLALQLAADHPTLVDRLVLVGAYAGWGGSLPPEEVAGRLGFARQVADDVAAGGWDPRSMPGLFSDVMPADRAAELAEVMSEIRAAGTRVMAQALADADLRFALPGIAAPTLVVAGGEDQRSSLAVARTIVDALPFADLTVMEGLGHECALEDPDGFHALVRTFLEVSGTR